MQLRYNVSSSMRQDSRPLPPKKIAQRKKLYTPGIVLFLPCRGKTYAVVRKNLFPRVVKNGHGNRGNYRLE